jgi:predicted DNA-binding transcriptional regulator AlpA
VADTLPLRPAPEADPAPTVEESHGHRTGGHPPAPAIEPELIDADQLASLLNVHAATLYRMQARSRLPAPLRLSRGCVRWRIQEIRDWLSAGAPDRKTWEARRGGTNGWR